MLDRNLCSSLYFHGASRVMARPAGRVQKVFANLARRVGSGGFEKYHGSGQVTLTQPDSARPDEVRPDPRGFT